jgi:CRP/FNR family transcriptional regulator, anaerobic regulatory protein
MAEETLLPRLDFTERPRYAAAATEDLLAGARALRQAFLQTPTRFAVRDAPLVRLGDPEPSVILVRNGFAFRSCSLADGRRAILHIVTPGDYLGLDHLVLARPIEEVTAACRVGYNTLPTAQVRELLKNPAVNLQILRLMAEARWRADRLAMSIGRLDAQARICVMLLDLYDRLRRQELISRLTFNLPLTQEQMADHLGLTLVHVNRTLRRLREERIVLVDRQVVIIMDLDRLREFAQGLPQPAELPEPRNGERVSADQWVGEVAWGPDTRPQSYRPL